MLIRGVTTLILQEREAEQRDGQYCVTHAYILVLFPHCSYLLV